jgi:ribose 5-phosphate isomerase B
VSKRTSQERPTVLIASDHAGFALKKWLTENLPEVLWQDLGPPTHTRVDYPDFAARVADLVGRREAAFGVLICGSGTGMCISANKFPGVRAVVGHEPIGVRLSRDHNDCNILCLGARFLAPEYAAELVRLFVGTPFSRDERHQGRLRKILGQEQR